MLCAKRAPASGSSCMGQDWILTECEIENTLYYSVFREMETLTDKVATLVDLLQYRSLHQRNKRAFTFLADRGAEAGCLTYGDLDLRARAIAAQLQQTTEPGDPV